jgi:hypothetical protein
VQAILSTSTAGAPSNDNGNGHVADVLFGKVRLANLPMLPSLHPICLYDIDLEN